MEKTSNLDYFKLMTQDMQNAVRSAQENCSKLWDLPAIRQLQPLKA
jgi:hypothetical protein